MSVILMKHKYLVIGIFSLLLLSIICQIIMGVIYHKLIHEADNMSATENKLLKQCKLKYTNCYKLNGRMVNTAVFVDKFTHKMKYAHLSLNKLSHLAGQLMMLSVFMTGVTVCLSLAAGDTLFQIIPYYLISILGLYLYFSISGLVDIPEKKTVLKTEIVDYLENHLMPRLEIEKERAMAEGRQIREADLEALRGETSSNQEESNQRPSAQVSSAESEYQEELEDLLEEFFA